VYESLIQLHVTPMITILRAVTRVTVLYTADLGVAVPIALYTAKCHTDMNHGHRLGSQGHPGAISMEYTTP